MIPHWLGIVILVWPVVGGAVWVYVLWDIGEFKVKDIPALFYCFAAGPGAIVVLVCAKIALRVDGEAIIWKRSQKSAKL